MIERRRPPAARLYYRRVLLLVAAFTLTIFPSVSKADNRHETVINNDDFDAPSHPEMAPIEDDAEENTEGFGAEGREELLGTPKILTPSVATEGDGGNEDYLVADAPGGAAADTGTAGSADTAKASELNSQQHSPPVPAIGEEGDASTAAAEGAAFEKEDDTPPVEPVGTDEGKDTGQEGISQEQEAGERRDGNVQPDEETKEGVKEAKLPTADGDSEETAGGGDIVVDVHHDTHEVLGSGRAELSVPAAVTIPDDDQVDSSDSIIHPVDGSAETTAAAATASAAESEEQQQQQQQQRRPPTASHDGSSLDAQASAATTAAAATQVKNPVATTKSGDNELEVSGSSSDDGEDDGIGAVDDDAESGTSFPSSVTESAAPGGREPQKPVRPGAPRSSTGSSTAAASDTDGMRPLQEEGSHSGRGDGLVDDGDGDGDDGGSGGAVNDDTAVDSTREDSKTGRRPEGVEEEDTETAPRNRSTSGDSGSSSSSSGWNEAGGHERHGGDVGQAESGEAGGGNEGPNRRDKDGGGRRDDDASRGAGGAEFPRGSPEQLAQRVRDMEAELVRKLLAEEDAKSLLDIWVERAREYVLTQTVPPTDAECDFSWSRLRCEPKCLCGARLRFGDYTPGRACRLLHPWERSPELCGGGEASADPWDPSDEPAFRRAAAAVAGALGGLRRAYEARVAPPSDPECHFSLETRRCEPQPLCRLRLRWGDITLTNGCRLAAVPEEKKPAAAAAARNKHAGSPIQ